MFHSMGVICYVLLAGYPPFYDEDQKRLFKKIKEGRYHFHEDYWGNTSPEAINLIQMMLCVDQVRYPCHVVVMCEVKVSARLRSGGWAVVMIVCLVRHTLYFGVGY
jgi:serine/threonine protein kinase